MPAIEIIPKQQTKKKKVIKKALRSFRYNKKKFLISHHYSISYISLTLTLILYIEKKNTGIIDGNFVIWYFTVPILYLEAGLSCSHKALFSVLRDGYLISFMMFFIYMLIPALAKIATYCLGNAGVNIRLLNGIEVRLSKFEIINLIVLYLKNTV